MEFRDFKNLTDEEKQFWQFEQLSKVASIDRRLETLEKKVDYIYIWATGVAAGVSFVFMFVKAKFFDK